MASCVRSCVRVRTATLWAASLALTACGGGGGGGGGGSPTPPAATALAASQYTVYKAGPTASLQSSAVLTASGAVSGVTATQAVVSLGADGSSTLTLTSAAATPAVFSATTSAGGAVSVWSARNGGVLMLCDGTAGAGGTPTVHYLGVATASGDAEGVATPITSAASLAGKSFRAVHDCVANTTPTMSFDSTGTRVEPDPTVPGNLATINQLLGGAAVTSPMNDSITGNFLGTTVYHLTAYQFTVGGVTKVYMVEQVNSDLTGSPSVTLRLLTSE